MDLPRHFSAEMTIWNGARLSRCSANLDLQYTNVDKHMTLAYGHGLYNPSVALAVMASSTSWTRCSPFFVCLREPPRRSSARKLFIQTNNNSLQTCLFVARPVFPQSILEPCKVPKIHSIEYLLPPATGSQTPVCTLGSKIDGHINISSKSASW